MPTRDEPISVVVPAHNEGKVLGRCLAAVSEAPVTVQVVVVANACVDDTATVARSFDVEVIETPISGKAHALNLGDRQCRYFPRVYLDADVVVSKDAFAHTIEALAIPGIHACAPRAVVDPKYASRAVRWYYDVWLKLPYVTENMVGSGFYALSEEGRGRFDSFPDVVADDYFIHSLFSPDERRATDGSFTIFPPRTLSTLLRIKTRVQAGNLRLRRSREGTFTGSGELSTRHRMMKVVVRSPDLWPKLPIYFAVQLAAKLLGRWRVARGVDRTWLRDETSRHAPFGSR